MLSGLRTEVGSPDGRIVIAIELSDGALPIEVHAIRAEMRECVAGLRSILRVNDAVVEHRREQTRDTE